MTITTATLPGGKVGAALLAGAERGDGNQPARVEDRERASPAGVGAEPRTGVISGTPTQTGTSSFTVKVTDATKPTAMTATANLSITVNPNVQAAVYVTEGGYSAVQSFPLGSSGNVKPTTSITGDATGLDATTAAVIDPVSGTLYVASAGNQEIAEYPYGATGNVAPSSVITGSRDRAGLPDRGRARWLWPAVRRQPLRQQRHRLRRRRDGQREAGRDDHRCRHRPGRSLGSGVRSGRASVGRQLGR